MNRLPVLTTRIKDRGRSPSGEKRPGYETPLPGAGSSRLQWLDMELTERCNNNCIHCCINVPATDEQAKKLERSTEEMKDVLREAASLGCLGVRFTGGEPLLREDFEEIYLFARRQGFGVCLFTNGTLLSPRLVRLFKRIPPLERIEITVHGMKERSYEEVTRTRHSFRAAWEGIHRLLENKVPFLVKGTVLPPNRGEMEEFEKWAETIPWMDTNPSYSLFLDLRCRRDRRKNARIERLRLQPVAGLRLLTRKPEEFVRAMGAFCSKFLAPPGDRLFNCGSGVGRVCVDAYGYLQPCILLKHPRAMYDLKKGSFQDALTHFIPALRALRASCPDYLQRCARCFLRGLCEQCPAKSWTEHGTLDTPVEYACEIAHAQARYLGLLRSHEMAWEVRNWRARVQKLGSQGKAAPGKP